ncbi:MAG: flagellar filament capping protein FliD, partial [Pseudomonadota bacterium]
DQYGSEATVEIAAVDTGTATSLGFDVSAGTAGVDVAGTIAGVVAIGTGQVLAGAEGSDVEGLTLTVSGGALGPRGSIEFTRGLGDQLDGLLTGLLADGGLLDARTDGIESSLDDIEDDRTALELRIGTIEARLRSQFTALDTLVAQLQSTGSFLQNALASLPAPPSATGN